MIEELSMSMVEYALDDNVAVVTMNSGENRFNLSFLGEFLDVLDEIENSTEANALVLKTAHEKIFSNGIDLDWLLPIIEKKDFKTARAFTETMMKLFRRILVFPMTTVAAIGGHAFAGGAIMCCYFDYRFMRTGRGYLCFPEVDLGIPFLPSMIAAMKKAIPMYKLEEMVYEGKRLTAEECEAHHIITKACPLEDLVGEAIAFAKGVNKRREVILELKKEMNKQVIYALDVEDPQAMERGRFSV